MGLAKRLLAAAFFAALAFSYLGPIIEGDFFYHLKAGESVFKSGLSLVFPTQGLGQAALYLVWKAAGFGGVVLLRAVVYLSALSMLYLWMKRAGVGFFERLFFILVPAHMFVSFPSERPQLFGFLFFALTVYLLERRRTDEKSGLVWAVPPVLLTWAFCHPAFVVGFLTVWVYFASFALSSLMRKKPFGPVVPIAAVALIPAVVVAFMPGFGAFIKGSVASLINPPPYMQSVHEYLSPFSAALNLGELYPAYWLCLALSGAAIIKRGREMPAEHVLMLVLFGALPLRGLRFMPFFTMLVPIASLYILRKKDARERTGPMLAGFAIVLALWVVSVPHKVRLGISEEFPEKAAAFINKAKPSGKVFDYQGWAGYLSWALPDRELFIPVADVAGDKDEAYGNIIWADKTTVMGKPQWDALLDAYGVGVIIMPGMSPISGELFPLTDALQEAEDWRLLYSDGFSNVFVRSTPENAGPIGLYSIPKGNAYVQVVAQAKRLLKEEPRRKEFWRSLGDAYLRLGDIKEADEAYKKSQGL